jgi:hypothetical protein
MADANVRINIETASLADLNAQLETLTAEIKKIPVGSAEFKRLSAEIRRVDGAVESANRKLKSLDVGAVAGDVAKLGGAVASASALFKQFGAEGSSSQEAIQGALETTNTILGAGAIAEGVASAARLAGVVATKAATVSQAAYTAVVGTSTGALKAFRIALAATGIGAIALAIGALVTNWENLAKIIGTSTKSNKQYREESDKLVESLKKQSEEFELNIERQRALGESEDELLRQRVEQNAEASKKLAQQQSELIDAKVRADTEYRKNASAENKKILEEATKNVDDLETEQIRLETQREKLQREGLERRIKILETGLERELFDVRDSEEKQLAVRTKFEQDKLAELKKSNIASKDELAKQQLTVEKALDDEVKYQEKVRQAQIDAERDYYNSRAELLDVTTEERLSTIDRNQTEEIKTLKKAGLSAAEIQTKTQELNLKYSFERIKVVQDEETKKLELVRDSVTKRLELEQKAAESAGDVEAVKRIQEAIKSVNEETQKAIDEANRQAQERLKQLFDAGKITKDAYEKAVKDLTKINQDFKSDLTKTTTEGGEGIVSTAIDSVITKFDTALNDTITNLGIAVDDAEKEYYKSITGRRGGELEQAQQNFLKKQIENRRTVAKATIDSADQEIKALEALTGLSTKEEEDRAKKILELRAKRSKAEVDLAKTTAETEKQIQDKRLAEIEAFFAEVEKYYSIVANSIQALGQIIADQATIQDLRFEEEIQAVDERYQREFDLLDEREKKFEEGVAARDKQLTTEERKRRALAKERSDLEKAQEQELADLENQRANAAADAAIKQANVNFALAVGQIAVSTAEAITKAIAVSPETFGLPFSAFAAAQGAIQYAAAESARSTAIAQAEASRPGVSGAKNVRVNKAEGGLITGPGNGVSDSVPANLSNGEFVVNANATSKYLPLLTRINQSGLQGGNAVNPGGFSDEAMVELLARIDNKLSQPTRSYVVASDIEDIQNKQIYINRRANVL